MASYSTNEFKTGLKILIDGDPYAIVENEMVKPGKGQAFSRVKIRNLKNGRVVERTWKSGDSVEAADVVDVDMQYLYTDGEFWTFMLQDTFEQHIAARHRDRSGVGPRLDAIGNHAVLTPGERGHAFDRHPRRPGAGDFRAHCIEKTGDVHHFRFAGRAFDDGNTLRQRRRHH